VLSAAATSPLVCFVQLFIRIPDKQLDEANKRRCSSGTKHERQTPEDGQAVMTEICRLLIMCFKNIFNNFSVLNVNIGVC
jgi:hypothetical protein